MLYVFDPVAMHNIVVKDQHIYEETAFFIKYVNPASAVSLPMDNLHRLQVVLSVLGSGFTRNPG